MPTLSFIVITHNRKDELALALDNLIGQDWPNKELILVDNGSNDGTAEFVRIGYPQVRLIESEVNLGVAGGRNRGAQAAIGEYLVFLDDDAEIVLSASLLRLRGNGVGCDGEPSSLGTILRAYFESDPRLAVIAFTIQSAATGAEEYASIPRFDKKSIAGDYFCSYFSGCGFAIRRDVFLETGMFWEALVYSGEELDLSYGLVQQGYRMLHTSLVRVNHRSVATARPKGQYIYYASRDRPWVALKNVPWPFVATTTIFWWSRLALTAVGTNQFGYFLQGVWDCLRGAVAVLRLRRPINTKALRIVRQTSGRLWW